MADTKLENLKTKHYLLQFKTGNRRGSFEIIRIYDKKKTKLYSFSEGFELYKTLKRTYRKSKKLFNEECGKLFK